MGILTQFQDYLRKHRSGPDRPLYKRVSDVMDAEPDFTPQTDEHATTESEWSEEMRKNRRIKHDFEKWCLDLVVERGEVPMSTIIKGGAWIFDCSSTTTRRYLEPMTSEFSPLEIRRNSARQYVVVLRESPEDSNLSGDGG